MSTAVVPDGDCTSGSVRIWLRLLLSTSCEMLGGLNSFCPAAADGDEEVGNQRQ